MKYAIDKQRGKAYLQIYEQLKKDIVNIFKIDQLLDFNNQTAMTATESSYRMSIRGKSINGTLSQQKVEGIEPIIHRVISIIQECGLYGKVLDEMPIMTQEDLMIREEAIKNGDISAFEKLIATVK